jgi:hypothetical protein
MAMPTIDDRPVAPWRISRRPIRGARQVAVIAAIPLWLGACAPVEGGPPQAAADTNPPTIETAPAPGPIALAPSITGAAAPVPAPVPVLLQPRPLPPPPAPPPVVAMSSPPAAPAPPPVVAMPVPPAAPAPPPVVAMPVPPPAPPPLLPRSRPLRRPPARPGRSRCGARPMRPGPRCRSAAGSPRRADPGENQPARRYCTASSRRKR